MRIFLYTIKNKNYGEGIYELEDHVGGRGIEFELVVG
jgi:hypothetical protein